MTYDTRIARRGFRSLDNVNQKHQRWHCQLLTEELMFRFSTACVCALLLTAARSKADVAPNHESKGSTKMVKTLEITNKDAWAIYAKYLEGWNSTSEEVRKKIVRETTSDDIQYKTKDHHLGGRNEIVEDMTSFTKTFPGAHFQIGDVSAHHDIALLTWVIVQADGKEFARGGDMLRINAVGKIESIITFPPASKTP